MKRKWIISLAAAAALAVTLVALRRSPRETPPTVTSVGPGKSLAITHAPEEIFRRAFWRRPTASDHIVHAERREWTEQDRDVQRWQWFLQVEPSAELLNALHDPAKFGLARVSAPRVASQSAAPPSWFPAAARLADCEILQDPAGSLTVYHRKKGNMIFATDAGRGFAPPVATVVHR